MRWRSWLACGVLLFMVVGLGAYVIAQQVELSEGRQQLQGARAALANSEKALTQLRNSQKSLVRQVESLQRELLVRRVIPTLVTGKPPLPVRVTFRDALLGSSLVARIENLSERHLRLMVSVRNPTLSRTGRFELELAPGEHEELGHLEGWSFSSGDEVGIYQDDYSGQQIIVP
jgi:hypothetical protein